MKKREISQSKSVSPLAKSKERGTAMGLPAIFCLLLIIGGALAGIIICLIKKSSPYDRREEVKTDSPQSVCCSREDNRTLLCVIEALAEIYKK